MKVPAIFDRLIRPPFIRRFDQWLLQNWPEVWRLQVHWVLMYALAAVVVLFVSGYLSAVNFHTLGVSPVGLFSARSTMVSVIVAMMAFLLFFVWRNKLSHFPSMHFKWYYTLLEILLYFICIIVICMAILAYGRGLSLKKRIAGEAIQLNTTAYLESNNYFFPAYIPHWFPEKNEKQTQYFQQGESLAGLFLKRSSRVFDSEDYYSPKRNYISPIELECSLLKFAPDSVSNAWDSMALSRNYRFYDQTLGFYRKAAPQFPLLFTGLTIAEGKQILLDKPDTYTDTWSIERSGAFDILIKGAYYVTAEEKINDTISKFHYKWFGYDYDNANSFGLRRVFAQKVFLESLILKERGQYIGYLQEIAKTADSTAFVFEYETIIPSKNGRVRDRNNLFFYDRRDSLGIREITRNDDEVFLKLNSNFNALYNALDTLSRFWYYEYLDYSRVDGHCDFKETNSFSQLISTNASKPDSLLLFDFFYRNKYYFGQTFFHYNQYLDYYFKKNTPERLDSLRQFFQKTGYPMAEIMPDSSGRTMLYAAFGFYRKAKNINYFLSGHQKCWARFDEEAKLMAYIAMYLAIFMFFLANTSTAAMLKNFVVGAITLGIVGLLLQLFGDDSENSLKFLYQLFIFGIPAIATIVFLAKSPYRSQSANLIVQLQIVISFFVINTDPHSKLGLNHKDWPSLELYIFLYWSLLLIIIAILFRRHQSLPEKT